MEKYIWYQKFLTDIMNVRYIQIRDNEPPLYITFLPEPEPYERF